MNAGYNLVEMSVKVLQCRIQKDWKVTITATAMFMCRCIHLHSK